MSTFLDHSPAVCALYRYVTLDWDRGEFIKFNMQREASQLVHLATSYWGFTCSLGDAPPYHETASEMLDAVKNDDSAFNDDKQRRIDEFLAALKAGELCQSEHFEHFE